jgi:hypothetical protein
VPAQGQGDHKSRPYECFIVIGAPWCMNIPGEQRETRNPGCRQVEEIKEQWKFYLRAR